MLLADGRVGPVEVGLLGVKRWRYQSPSGSRVHTGSAEPANWDGQSLGGSSPCSPRPGRKWKSSRSGPPARAARNQGCWSETWFGTMSTRVRMPSSRASAISFSASASVPKAGSMAR